MVITISANVNNNIAGVAANDIYLDQFGNISLSYDQQAILQQCAQAAQTILGECIFNTTIGIPFEQTVWGGIKNELQYQAALRQAFLAVNGVTEVVSLMTSQTGDTLTYNAVIQTIYGSGAING